MLRTALALALTLAAAANAAQSLGPPRELAPELVLVPLATHSELTALCAELEAAAKNSRHGVSAKTDAGTAGRVPSTQDFVCEIFVVDGRLVVAGTKAQFLSHDPIGFADSMSLYAFAGFDPVNNWDPVGLTILPIQDPQLARAVEMARGSPTGAAIIGALESSPVAFQLVPMSLPGKILGLTGNAPEIGITNMENPTGGPAGQGSVTIGIDIKKIEGAAPKAADALTKLVEQLPENPTPGQVEAVIQAAEEFRKSEIYTVPFVVTHELGHGLDFEHGWTDKGPAPGDEALLDKQAAQVLGELENKLRGKDPREPNPFARAPDEVGRPPPRKGGVDIPPPIKTPEWLNRPDPRQLLQGGGVGVPQVHKNSLAPPSGPGANR